ncbi:MAG: tripartite tricarboxylate transporter TctB family protein [Treponema sp.]|jgi:hypothetical protein|nr:tripartite tricarboxylate transporter TctB family protein [Treponema sp.]
MTPRADFFTGIGIVVFSAAMFAVAGRMSPPASFGLGPGGYPMLVTGVLGALGIILAIQGWLQRRRVLRTEAARTEEVSAQAGAAQTKKLLSPREFRGILILALSFWLYVVLLKYLGYLITTPIFLFLFLLQYGDRNWLRMLLVSVITTAASWALFVYAFRIFLPDFYFL